MTILLPTIFCVYIPRFYFFTYSFLKRDWQRKSREEVLFESAIEEKEHGLDRSLISSIKGLIRFYLD